MTQSGTLSVVARREDGAEHVIFADQKPGGIHTFMFDPDALANGQYVSVEATWTTNVGEASGEHSARFNVLGVFTHTRYNTPQEALCAGGDVNVYLRTNPNVSCTYTQGPMNDIFRQEAWENGSGLRRNGQFALRDSGFCQTSGGAPYPGGSFAAWWEHAFGLATQKTPSCPNQKVGSNTVAVDLKMMAGTLKCGDWILIDGEGLKVVADDCPVCETAKIDNYDASPACRGMGGVIATIGSRKTIRLDEPIVRRRAGEGGQ